MLQRMNVVLVKHSKWLYGIIAVLMIIALVCVIDRLSLSQLFQHNVNKMGEVLGEDIMVKDVQETMDIARLIQYPAIFAYNKDRAKDFRPDFNEDNLFGSTVLIKVAAKMGFTASDKEVQKAISEMKAFQEDGKFSQKKYDEFRDVCLTPNGFTFAKFEQAVATELAIVKMQETIGSDVSVTDGEVNEMAKGLSVNVTVSTVKFDGKNFTAGLKADDKEIEAEYKSNGKAYMSDPVSDAIVVSVNTKDMKTDAQKIEARKKLENAVNEVKKSNVFTKENIAKFAKAAGAQVSEVKGLTVNSPETATTPKNVIARVCNLAKVNDVTAVIPADNLFAFAVLTKRIEAKQLPLDKELKAKIAQVVIDRKANKAALEAAKQCRADAVEKKLTGANLKKAVEAAKGTFAEKETKQKFEYLTTAQRTQMFLQMMIQQLSQSGNQSPELIAMLQKEELNIMKSVWKANQEVGSISEVDPSNATFLVIDSLSPATDLNAEQKNLIREELKQTKIQRARATWEKWLDDNTVRYGKGKQQAQE